MKPRHRLLFAVTAALFAATAMAQQAATSQKLSSSDRAFLADTLGTNQLEIDISAYAVKQAHSDKVREFATARLAAHKDLATQFQKANDGIVPAPGPTQQPGENLLGKTGADFDHAYLAMMANYDHGLVAKFQGADGPQHGQAIRDMVKATLPEIRKHDAESKALEHSLPAK